MSTINKKIDSNAEHKNAPSTFFAAKTLEKCADGDCASFGLHSSHSSTISSDGDLSLLSLSLDNELMGNSHAIDMDELPVFEIRLISPLGRTPSPIDSEDVETPTRQSSSIGELLTQNPCRNNPEFVALHDINAQISPPSDNASENESSLNRTCSLETIYEGVFLNTPPRERNSLHNNRNMRSRTNLLEKVALNRLNAGKENQSPTSKCKISPQHAPIELGCKTNAFAVDEKHNLS